MKNEFARRTNLKKRGYYAVSHNPENLQIS